MKIIILAGGSGTRLWPLSRERYPKQFIKLKDSNTSLFQETFLRGMDLTSADDIYVVTNQNYKFLVMGEVEELGIAYNEDNILVEPEPKNTLPAIYAGVDEILKREEDSVIVFPSDHKIIKNKEFVDIIKSSEFMTKGGIVTFGINPDTPNTGYGYIAPGQEIEGGYVVSEFKEKPDLDTAKEYIEKGYLWNSGIFMFNARMFAEEVKLHQPEIYNSFENSNGIFEAFSKIEKGISVDYGIMEKTSNVSVVPISIGWNDLGSFDSFYDVYAKDENSNVVDDGNIMIDSKNNFILSEKGKMVASVGIEDLIVVDNRDALLICKREDSQKVKQVVEKLKEKQDNRVIYNTTDYRPWGNYKILEEEKDSFKIKRIKVKQGKKLSYQLHHHRSEHWIVVKGMANITIDDEERLVTAGESIFIRPGQKHRLENPGKIDLEIIEVQMGPYLEEDDIIRFDDVYGRK